MIQYMLNWTKKVFTDEIVLFIICEKSTLQKTIHSVFPSKSIFIKAASRDDIPTTFSHITHYYSIVTPTRFVF